MIENKVQSLAFLNGGGAMGDAIRAKDWTSSPLGPPETWPLSLQTTVSILLNSQFPMFIWWSDELITIYNDTYRPIAGDKHPALLGKSGKEAWAEIWQDLSPLVESVFNGTATWSEDQLLLMNRHGYVEETYFTFSYSPIRDENGTVVGLFCACIETTGKVLANRRIRESERNLRATILQSPVAMSIVRGNDYVLEIANDRMYELWGRGPEELLHRPIFEGLPEVRNQGLEGLLQQVRQTGEAFTAKELPIQLPRNNKLETAYLNFVYEPFRDGDGQISGIICVASEVTDLVLARKKTEESEQNFRNLVEQAPVAISVLMGRHYTVEIVNASMLRTFGKTANELLYKPLFESMPQIRREFEPLITHVYQTGERITANEQSLLVLKEGQEQTRYVNLVYEPLKEENGTVKGLMLVALDVTEQVKARRTIEESSEELQLAIEVANLGTFRLNLLTGKVTYSQRIMGWFGFTEQGLPLKNIMPYVYPDDRAVVWQAFQNANSNPDKGQHDVTYRVVHPQDGTLRYLHSFGRTYFTPEKQPYLMVGMIQDITAQVLYQQQLRENEAELQKRVEERTNELESLNNELKATNANLEEFAYAASHDMKEPIRKIHLFADRLKQELNDQLSPQQQHLFNRVENAVNRMNMLIEDLLTYSHVSKGMSHQESVDLNVKVQNVLEDLEVEIEEKNAEIQITPLPVILGHKRQMQQLFQNLIGNALKYSQPGVRPQISISSSEVLPADVPLPLKAVEAQNKFHRIEVRDNGIGFEQEDAERIFNVFTRLHGNAEYKGTGVGLSIVKKVVDNHSGYIWAESKPGHGAAFILLLPVTQSA